MTRRMAAAVLWALVSIWAAASPVRASPPPASIPGCEYGVPDGAEVLTCVPPSPIQWNRDLVVFAHGYVAPTVDPPQIPWDQLELPDGTSIPGIVMSLGFGFATTSYSDDGLVVLDPDNPGRLPTAVQDLVDLVNTFQGGR